MQPTSVGLVVIEVTKETHKRSLKVTLPKKKIYKAPKETHKLKKKLNASRQK